MSKIVVAIDFSDCSINAFLHALSIAQKCASDMSLVWVKKSPETKDKFEHSEYSSKEVISQFEALIGKYQPELPAQKMTYKIRTGKVYREIAAEAKEINAMLIVVEPTARSLGTAAQIKTLAGDLHLTRLFLVGSKVKDEADQAFIAERSPGLDVLGYVPDDPAVREADRKGLCAYDLSPTLAQTARDILTSLETKAQG